MSETDPTAELVDLAYDVLTSRCNAIDMALPDDHASVLQPMVEAILDTAASQRWIQKQLDETGLKAMDFRNGMTMEIEPARELVAHWVGAARAMLGDAPNYSETPIEMEVKVGEDPQRFAFILQRVGKLTPHQARQQAEARAEKAERAADLVAHGYRQAEATLERVRAVADQLADGTEAGFRAALAIRTALEAPEAER